MLFRKYLKQDFEQVRKICMDTAPGNYSKIPKKREAVALMFADYALKYEPESCFVAVEKDKICGYCFAYTDMKRLKLAVKTDLAKNVAKINPFYALFFKICTATSIKFDKLYGTGGFHINIANNFQGQSIGPKLLTILGKHLKNLGYKFLWLITKNRKTTGYKFYKHFGFVEAKHAGGGSLCLTYNLDRIDEKLQKYQIDFDNVIRQKS